MCCAAGRAAAASSVLRRGTNGSGNCNTHQRCLKLRIAAAVAKAARLLLQLLHGANGQTLRSKEGIRVSEGISRSVRAWTRRIRINLTRPAEFRWHR